MRDLGTELMVAILWCNFEEDVVNEFNQEILQQLWYEFKVGNANLVADIT